MVHVNDIVARLEVREIAEEARRLRPRARALRRKRFKQVGVSVDSELRLGKDDAFVREAEMFDGQPRRKLERERPLVFVENVARRGLGERILCSVKSFREARAIFFHGSVEKRRFIQDHDRIRCEIEQHAGAFFERHLAKLPSGVKARRRGVVLAAGPGPDALPLEHFSVALQFDERKERRSTGFVERCVLGSNARMDSIVSPSSSMRTGCGVSGENTSMMPPRTAYCPGISQVTCFSYPAATRKPMSSSWGTDSSRATTRASPG